MAKQIWLNQLKADARGYYYALVTGYPLEVHKKRVQRSIYKLIHLGVSRECIEDILSDIALEVC